MDGTDGLEREILSSVPVAAFRGSFSASSVEFRGGLKRSLTGCFAALRMLGDFQMVPPSGEQLSCTASKSAQDVPRNWMGGRVVECARLESVLGLNNPRGFESLPIRSAPSGARKHRISEGIR